MDNQALILSDDIQNKAGQVFDLIDVSTTTRTDYKQRIKWFLDFTKTNGFNRNSFLEFKRCLESRVDLTVSTKNKYLATARVFLRELNRLGFIPADITLNIKTFRQIKKHKKSGLNKKEIESLAEEIRPLPDNPKNSRLKAFFCLLAFQGLRQIEIVRLDVKDVDLVNGTAFIRGKGNDDKEIIYLAPETTRVLKKYIRINKVGSGALFKSFGNRQSERLTTITIKREVKNLFENLGIDRTTHAFRHYYITTLLQKLSVRDVRKFSRHRSLEMLIVYDDEIDIKNKSSKVFGCFNQLKVS